MFKLFSKKESYEGELYKKFGKANKLNKSISILFISDTHNALYGRVREFENVIKEHYDVCILLGDHSNSDIEIILKYVPLEKIYGVLGNHDTFTLYENYNIPNIHAKAIEVGGVMIGGFEGSFKYSSKEKPMHTHEESIEILSELEPVDILVTHDKAFLIDNNDPPHDGLKGITNYLFENKVPYHVHGHLHENSEIKLLNKTMSYCIYPFKVINFK